MTKSLTLLSNQDLATILGGSGVPTAGNMPGLQSCNAGGLARPILQATKFIITEAGKTALVNTTLNSISAAATAVQKIPRHPVQQPLAQRTHRWLH